MVSATVLRGHLVHFFVFGIPVAGLVAAVARQEIRGRRNDRLAAAPGEDRARSPEPAYRLDGGSAGLRIAAIGLVAAAAIHAIVIPEHFREYVLFGVFFSVLAAAQVWLAMVLAHRPDQRTVLYVAVGSLCVVGLWLVSRTSGVPIGPEPWQAESLGALDIVATCAEVVTAVGCIVQLWSVADRRRFVAPQSAGVAR